MKFRYRQQHKQHKHYAGVEISFQNQDQNVQAYYNMDILYMCESSLA